MIILLFFIFLGLTFLTIVVDGEDLALFPLFGAFACLIVAIVLCVCVSDGSVIDKKLQCTKKKILK